jgi:hypothetical protein
MLDWFDLFLKPIDLIILKGMTGIFYGQILVEEKAIYMRVLMNSKK